MAASVEKIASMNLATCPDGLDPDLDRLRELLNRQALSDADRWDVNFAARRLGLAEGGQLAMAAALALIQRTKTRIPLRDPYASSRSY